MDRQPVPPGPDAARTDEAQAAETRRRLRDEGIVPIEPDERVRVMLVDDERVVSVRRGVSIERRTASRDPGRALQADLYLTTQRLLGLGRVPIDLPLGQIREAVVATGALRLVVGDGLGMEIRTPDPSVLRVEIAALRAAGRAVPSADGTPPRDVGQR